MSSTSFVWFVPAGDYTRKLSSFRPSRWPIGHFMAGRPPTWPKCHVIDPGDNKHTLHWSTPWVWGRFDRRAPKGFTLDWRAHLSGLTANMQSTIITTDQRRESEASLSKSVTDDLTPWPIGLRVADRPPPGSAGDLVSRACQDRSKAWR
jgi:hypothetical protein